MHGYYYRLMSSTPYHIPRAGQHTVPVCPSVRVNRGDVIGFYFRGSTIPFDGHERCGPLIGYYHQHPHPASAVHVGKWFRFYPMRPGWNPCRKYSLEATIEGFLFNLISYTIHTPVNTSFGLLTYFLLSGVGMSLMIIGMTSRCISVYNTCTLL